MQTYDIVVVGGSFAGLSFAHHIARNYRVLLLDRKKEIGISVESTGLITNATKNLFAEFTPIEKFLPNHIDTIGVIAPDYERYFFSRTSESWIYSTDTQNLVAHIAATLPKNVTVETSALFQSVEYHAGQDFPVTVFYTQNGQKKEVQTRFVIGADGGNSSVAKAANLSVNTRFLGAMEKAFYGDILLGTAPQSTVYHFWFGEFSLGYGGWLAPTVVNGRSAFRVGLAKHKKDIHTLRKLDDFIDILKRKGIIRLTDRENIVTFGSLIPIGGALKKVHNDFALLLGDAAGLCGAFAADGIKGALVSAKVAVELVPRFLSGEKNVLAQYYPMIQKHHGKLMTYYKKQLLYRFLWNRMKSDRTFQALYDIISGSQEEFLLQFCDNKEKNRSLITAVISWKNLGKLFKYAWYLCLDLWKK